MPFHPISTGTRKPLVAACILGSILLFAGSSQAQPKPEESSKIGCDIYYGLTNLSGVNHSLTDDMWAGSETAFPSTVYFQWNHGDDNSLKLSLGIGDMSTGSNHAVMQPVEAFYKTPAFSGKLTIGKFYVPFALQEWEYETKWGAMYETELSGIGIAGSVNYNENMRTQNYYTRFSHKCGNGVVGISGAFGRGFTYNTQHNLALGIDATQSFGKISLNGEWLTCPQRGSHFQFGFAKATYTGLGRFTPAIAGYYWHDPTGELGHFTSCVVGVSYKLNDSVSLEPSYSRANGRNIYWAQAHLTM